MDQAIIYIGAGYMQSRDGSMYALEAATGSLLWRYPIPDAVSSYPTTDHTGIYFSASNGHIYALAKDGSLLWRSSGRRALSLAATNSLLFTATGYNTIGEISALRLQDRKRIWRWRDSWGQGGVTGLVVANEAVYVGIGPTGGLYALSANNGSLLWHALDGMSATAAAVGP